MIVDVHSHFFPPAFLEEIGRRGGKYDVQLQRGTEGQPVLVQQGRRHPALRPFSDIQERLAYMDGAGIDVHALSLSAQLNLFWPEGADALALCELLNDEYARLAQAHPGRFVGVAAVPLQDVPLALKELDRAVTKRGLRAVGILSNVRGTYLDDPRFYPFYERVQDLGVPIQVHPANPVGKEQMQEFELMNSVGFPLDSTLSIARLILSGTLERFPRLRFIYYHGGGAIPYVKGRMDHNWGQRQEARKAIALRPPSAYLEQFYFDTILHDHRALAYLIEAVGADQVVLGSDCAYDMADLDPVGSLKAVPGLAEEARRKILGENAARLYRL
ncbi:MAG: amidohydrolase [Deltaproteobacteria bacterium]|nr:amidohydrolase [Deltaproteobacteria bacterium]